MAHATQVGFLPKRLPMLLVLSAVIVGVGLTRFHSFLLFHSLAEFFSIAVAFGVFTVFWNSRRFLDNGFFLFLGIAYLFIGLVDLLHTLAYQDMGVFEEGANLATQLWLVARYVQAAAFLAAPLFLRHRFNAGLIFGVYTVVVGLLLASIFALDVFPTTLVPGEGATEYELTNFKIYSEYGVCLAMGVALILLYRCREDIEPVVFELLVLTIAVTIASEIAFTFYQDVTGTMNMIGHLLKLAASYLMYVAFVEVGLRSPYSVLFRNLRESEQQLREINETLEQRVAERTLVAEERSGLLRALAAELALTEQRERRRLAKTLHDHLQQLLVAAKLKLAVLKKRTGEPDLRERITKVDELLNDSIDVSRSLTVELSPPVLYDAGFGAALEWLARHMQEKHGFAVEVCVEPGSEPASEDLRVFLFDAVRELLFNVVKHAGTAQATVRLATPEEGVLQIVVEDKGVGLVDEKLEFGARESGFGLFSIRERLELLGGRMEIQSSADQGTCVSLLVPSRREEVLPPEPFLASEPRRRPADAQIRAPRCPEDCRVRILLADDHAMFRHGLATLLAEQPDVQIVAEAGDGRTALMLAEQMNPDVIVMDVAMPGLDGIEATRRIRQAMPGIRVIGLSMHEEDDMARQMLDAGASAYLRKDGSFERLVAAIRDQHSRPQAVIDRTPPRSQETALPGTSRSDW